MIKNIVFDFGGVLVDWDPHYLYDAYFGDRARADWFLTNVCPFSWHTRMDAGEPVAECLAERKALFPEWSDEIQMYYDRWLEMVRGQIPGMEELIRELRAQGYRILGLSNWSAELFRITRPHFPVFDLIEGMVISGEERLVKPDEVIFRLLLERFSIRPEESVFIDDNPANVAAARRVGLYAIQFRCANELRNELAGVLSGPNGGPQSTF